jgi:hypothetical protein
MNMVDEKDQVLPSNPTVLVDKHFQRPGLDHLRFMPVITMQVGYQRHSKQATKILHT